MPALRTLPPATWCTAPARAGRPAQLLLQHAVCVLRVLLLLPVLACIVVAWLAATVLTLGYLALAAPFRRGGRPTLD